MSDAPPSAPKFPQYPPPNPAGLQVADRKQSDPLWKLAKLMLKPKLSKLQKTPISKKKVKKDPGVRYY